MELLDASEFLRNIEKATIFINSVDYSMAQFTVGNKKQKS